MKKNKLLTNSEIASFCRQTAMILKAGITPVEGMEILLHDTISNDGRELLEQLALSCRQGNPFFEALEGTGVFPEYVVKLVSLGEESGNTDNVLISLAEYYEREDAVSESVKNAVTYPLIMIIMMFVVIIVLITRVLPIFRQVFAQLGTQMSPLATSLLNLGNTLSKYSMAFTIVLFFVAAIFIILYKTPKGRSNIKHFLTRFPLTKRFYDKVASGRFASGMYLAFTSGMDTYHSLDMVSDIVENDAMCEKIRVCKDEIQNGSSLPEALSNSHIFSNLYSRMVMVGFRSGSIDTVMKQIAQNYDDETEKQLNHIISIIEPTLVIILSLIVGMILMSVLLPLMGIMSSIG